ncbi:hypothetical protein QJ48_27690 [Paenibacillus sp. A3]|uniref:hypothetical protein n=1 Tax=Paenibacillus sp. A3 TaxID=1337054 RepID=UPI0006D5A2CD|nr:hypothetical protein [Paenibacillus sp. A3]KPV56451.1 hypothetical protein QJ48_27690 [Paenibacillus sp. A3]
MISSAMKAAAALWVDDYLDLYNYAGRIGDTAWQQEITDILKQKDAYVSEAVRTRKLEELWMTFDSINRKMLELYRELRETNDAWVTERLREQVMELKTERITVSRKIKAEQA